MLSRFFKQPATESSNDSDATTPDVAPGEAPGVIMYSTSWCPSCKAAKQYLRQNDVPYEEIDIDEVPGAAEQVQAWARGYKTVPTFVIGKVVVVDWNRRTVERTLREAGYDV